MLAFRAAARRLTILSTRTPFVMTTTPPSCCCTATAARAAVATGMTSMARHQQHQQPQLQHQQVGCAWISTSTAPSSSQTPSPAQLHSNQQPPPPASTRLSSSIPAHNARPSGDGKEPPNNDDDHGNDGYEQKESFGSKWFRRLVTAFAFYLLAKYAVEYMVQRNHVTTSTHHRTGSTQQSNVCRALT